MFKKILIANRGEIACRIIKTAHALGVQTIAVYSDADKNSPHVAQADSAFYIGESSAKLSYLNISAIITAAKLSGAEAIHPGYGFLAENPQFAKACEGANITFIGPPLAAIQLMGSKQKAKQLLEETQVPLIPGYHGLGQSEEELFSAARSIGFPLLLKAAAGGGGKGMRRVNKEAEFLQSLAAAKREALTFFADDTLIIEKCFINPRHVEVQIMADNWGNVVHLFERDCSIQRRYQKIIEEAPAPNLPTLLRQKLAKAACKVAQAIAYRGAGTVEFLVDKKNYYFMEMNTRLQVEHPVTEMITGFDLVAWQLKIAANEPLPCSQQNITAKGHAIECRVYAEDPVDFIPAIGQIHFLKEPLGEGIRVDSGIAKGTLVTEYYDSMLAKLIAWGSSRGEALQRLQHALDQYVIAGIKTNIPFLQAICSHSQFVKGQLSCDFLTRKNLTILPVDTHWALYFAVSHDYLKLKKQLHDPLKVHSFGWQMAKPRHWYWRYVIAGIYCEVKITPINDCCFKLQSGDHLIALYAYCKNEFLAVHDGQQSQQAYIDDKKQQLVIYFSQGRLVVERFEWQLFTAQASAQLYQLRAPMTATVVAILKTKGDKVIAGESLMILEAMKMEHTIHAPKDGILTELFYEVGSQVNEGAELLALED